MILKVRYYTKFNLEQFKAYKVMFAMQKQMEIFSGRWIFGCTRDK
jgi:hypothetical protein